MGASYSTWATLGVQECGVGGPFTHALGGVSFSYLSSLLMMLSARLRGNRRVGVVCGFSKGIKYVLEWRGLDYIIILELCFFFVLVV